MSLTIDGLTEKELEAARDALVSLYESREEYSQAKARLNAVELRMTRLYHTVNYFFNHVKKEGESK